MPPTTMPARTVNVRLVAIASLLLQAERPGTSLKAFRPIVDTLPAAELASAATLLDLADQVERRTPPSEVLEPSVVARDATIEVHAPVSHWWRGEECLDRFSATFGRELVIVSTLD